MKIIYDTTTDLIKDIVSDNTDLLNLKSPFDYVYVDMDIDLEDLEAVNAIKGTSINNYTANVSIKSVEKLAESDTSGEMIRVIEDLADAIIALGGTVPQPALDKINNRKNLREDI